MSIIPLIILLFYHPFYHFLQNERTLTLTLFEKFYLIQKESEGAYHQLVASLASKSIVKAAKVVAQCLRVPQGRAEFSKAPGGGPPA